MKKKSESDSSVVPQPHAVREKFTPSSVEQSGLGPAFFAVVIAIIALILLSIFGNNYLTGAYHAVPGGAFNTVNIDFRSSILTNGTDQALTLWVRTWNTSIVPGYPNPWSPLPNYFVFDHRPYLSEFYVMARNLNAHHPYPALIYRDNVTGVLTYASRVNLTDPCPRGYEDRGEWYPTIYAGENVFRTWMIYTVYEPRTFLVPMSIFSSENRIYAELEDGVPGAFVHACWSYGPGNRWIITFSKTRYPYALVVENVQYRYADGRTINVRGGFISPTGSLFRYYRGLLPTRNVLIEYAYPTR